MNYRHGYHAGNFADVVKHLALVAILLHLRKKDTAFTVVDSHAGRGIYDLSGQQACKTAEAKNGIGQLAELSGDMPQALASYLSLVREIGRGQYPGSPLVIAKLLRARDRLIAIEKHPEEFAILQQTLGPFRQAVAECGDGYARTLKLVPPTSRRGLVLIDPPFESQDEFSVLARTVREAARKFATGIYLVWYAMKSKAEADAFCGEVLAGGLAKAMTIETAISAAPGKLARAGLLIVNPPYGFAAVFHDIGALIAPLLQASIKCTWLIGEE
jgi:23S rRNA (adenine2030-N6)-methyltransferase